MSLTVTHPQYIPADHWWEDKLFNTFVPMLTSALERQRQRDENRKQNVLRGEVLKQLGVQSGGGQGVPLPEPEGYNSNPWAKAAHQNGSPLAQFDAGTADLLPPSTQRKAPNMQDIYNVYGQVAADPRFSMVSPEWLEQAAQNHMKVAEAQRMNDLRGGYADKYGNAGTWDDRMNVLTQANIEGAADNDLLKTVSGYGQYRQPYHQPYTQNRGGSSAYGSFNPATGEWTQYGEFENTLTPQEQQAAQQWRDTFNEGNKRWGIERGDKRIDADRDYELKKRGLDLQQQEMETRNQGQISPIDKTRVDFYSNRIKQNESAIMSMQKMKSQLPNNDPYIQELDREIARLQEEIRADRAEVSRILGLQQGNQNTNPTQETLPPVGQLGGTNTPSLPPVPSNYRSGKGPAIAAGAGAALRSIPTGAGATAVAGANSTPMMAIPEFGVGVAPAPAPATTGIGSRFWGAFKSIASKIGGQAAIAILSDMFFPKAAGETPEELEALRGSQPQVDAISGAAPAMPQNTSTNDQILWQGEGLPPITQSDYTSMLQQVISGQHPSIYTPDELNMYLEGQGYSPVQQELAASQSNGVSTAQNGGSFWNTVSGLFGATPAYADELPQSSQSSNGALAANMLSALPNVPMKTLPYRPEEDDPYPIKLMSDPPIYTDKNGKPAPPEIQRQYLERDGYRLDENGNIISRPQMEPLRGTTISTPHNVGGLITGNNRLTVTTPFHKQRPRKGGGTYYHDAVDYAIPGGTELRVPDYGVPFTVNRVRNDPKGYGNYVDLSANINGHKVDLRLAHLQNNGVNVKVGQTLRPGDLIGLSGNTGNSRGKNGGYHLHLETKVDGKAVDPRNFMLETNSSNLLAGNNAPEVTGTTFNGEVLPGLSPNGVFGASLTPMGMSGGAPASTSAPKYADIIDGAAQKYGIDNELIQAIIEIESTWASKATSNKGAMGLMQLMPGTARSLGVRDAYDPAQNIEGGSKYIAQLINRYGGDVNKALMAYNCGPGNVKRGRIPKASRAYAKKVMGIYNRLKGQRAAPQQTQKPTAPAPAPQQQKAPDGSSISWVNSNNQPMLNASGEPFTDDLYNQWAEMIDAGEYRDVGLNTRADLDRWLANKGMRRVKPSVDRGLVRLNNANTINIPADVYDADIAPEPPNPQTSPASFPAPSFTDELNGTRPQDLQGMLDDLNGIALGENPGWGAAFHDRFGSPLMTFGRS